MVIDKAKLGAARYASLKYAPTSDFSRSEYIIRDGEENGFPAYIANIVSKSPTATMCHSQFKKHVAGVGFNDETLYRLKTCAEETFLEAHLSVCDDYALYRRVAIAVYWTVQNGRFYISKFTPLPAKWVRYLPSQTHPRKPDEWGRLTYSPFMGDSEYLTFREEIRIYYPFTANPDEIIAQINHCHTVGGEYVGQLLYYNQMPKQNSLYSIPPFMSVENFMKAEFEGGFSLYYTSANNFGIPAIMVVEGDGNELVDDPESRNEYGECTRKITRKELVQRELAENHGGENIGSMVVMFGMNGTNGIDFKPFPSNKDTHTLIEKMNEVTERLIARGWQVPNVLAGIEQAGKLGNSKDVENAIKVLNSNTENDRYLIEGIYNRLLSNFLGYVMPEEGLRITPVSAVLEVPAEIISLMTPEQKADYLFENFGIQKPQTAI
jgi:hypothetical protein